MKSFEFIAFNSSGKKKLGTVRAPSLPEAKKKILKRGFYLAHIKFHGGSGPYSQNPISFFRWIKETFLSG
ncbi:MAG TPA: hypothetical protein VNN20_03720, partial [Thermodesulfobacteriota bacterium]|nr:hypothetical protein [Thermodesulfobacteriota bacterium]